MVTRGEGTGGDKKRAMASPLLINGQHRAIYEESEAIRFIAQNRGWTKNPKQKQTAAHY